MIMTVGANISFNIGLHFLTVFCCLCVFMSLLFCLYNFVFCFYHHEHYFSGYVISHQIDNKFMYWP